MLAFGLVALLTFSAPCQGLGVPFLSVFEYEVDEATKLYFANNPRFDEGGFNVIDFEEDWPITELFQQQYGESASTSSYIAARVDFRNFVTCNTCSVTFNDVYQLIKQGEHQDARQEFAAFSRNLVDEWVDSNSTIALAYVEDAKQAIRLRFNSLMGILESDEFASFLNLKLGSSLSFVMDTTGSMGGEIEAAKSRVVDIVTETRGTNSDPLNYVLVPYNDPGYGPVTKTTNSTEFISAVNALTARGGGDFPELAMIGILLAAQNSNFRSIVYVFTDASEKDTKLQNHVIALCLIKKISVNIFLTENIARRKRALLTGRSLYDHIAELTGGAVIRVDKDYIDNATEIMKASTVQGAVTLVSQTRSNSSQISVQVDSTIRSLTVQFTGSFTYEDYTSTGAGDEEMVVLADIPDVKLFRLDDVSSGTYVFNFNPATANEYAVVIRGMSGLGFHASLFQKKRGTNTFVSSRQLLAGAITRAEMTIFGDAENLNFTVFQLVSHGGEVLLEKSLHAKSSGGYYVEEFSLPSEPMFVRLQGLYEQQPIVRIDPCAITPTVSESYFEDIADVTIVAGTSIQVTTVLHNNGGLDSFILQVSDIREFVTIQGATSELLEFSLADAGERTITLNIAVPAGTTSGVLSKVLLTATGVTDNYFVFIDFVIRVQDEIIRCPTPTIPTGGELECTPDARSVNSTCYLQCGEEYALEGEGVMTCQEDGTWSPETPGTCRLLGSKTCSFNGDPHYSTFDGRYYDFQGSCLYTVVQTKNVSGLEQITIQAENDFFYGGTAVTWLKQAFITVSGTTVHFKFGKIVLVDGIRVELPVILNGGNLQIKIDGGHVLLTTSFKMEVRYDGAHFFRVTLPGRYINQVSGLCGNYDGDANNEFMVGNETFSAASSFGNALEIVGGSNPWCRRGQPEDDGTGCPNDAIEAIYAERCSAIKSDCFADCADNDTVEAAFRGCVYDMCRVQGNDKAAEDAISDFANRCQRNGFQICNWRDRFDFPTPFCGANQHYEFQANSCPNTCVNPTASARCQSQPRTEGCVCNTGFVLDGTDCVRISDCGCASQGRYYKKGFSFLREQCSERCECMNGAITCSAFSCDEGTECRTLDTGRLGCAQQQVDRFCAAGDPHYTTLDGTRFDFMGTCRYIMMQTSSDSISDSDRLITISAQNENRGGNTRVSYVREVYIEIGYYTVQLGPGNTIRVMLNGSELDVELPFSSERDVFSTQVVGRNARLTTKFGIKATFDGSRFCVDVPSYYMHKVSGLGSANYTGSQEDDLGGLSVQDFAAKYIYEDGCDEGVIEEFVCSDADKAKWGGEEFCGKIKNTEGPFQYCMDEVSPDAFFDNCVFDACATEGDDAVITAAIEAYAQECRNRPNPLVQCDWASQLGIEYDCPENSQYEGCASICMDTCQNPNAVDSCQSGEEVERCVCKLGYIMNDGVCVKESSCGCIFEDGTYHEQGFTQMAENCIYSSTCSGAQNITVEEDPCGEFATCQEQDGEFQCVPNELPYALIYGAINFRTFDDKHFTFRGNCGYLVAGHMAYDDMDLVPSWNVYIRNGEGHCGMTRINEVVVEVWGIAENKHTVTISREREVMINGIRARFGTKLERVEVRYERGDAVLDFSFGLHVRFNGYDWVRIDVDNYYKEKVFGLAGNFNEDPDDDFVHDDIMRTEEQWGDFWYRDRFSSDECATTTNVADMTCPHRQRFESSCDCGVLKKMDGPFAACHEKVDPQPFFVSCIKDACLLDGSTTSIARILRTYYRACIGKGVLIENWRDEVAIPMECPMHSHYENCADECQPTWGDLEARCISPVCQEGCVCDDGYVLSDGECVEMEKFGCMAENGFYYEHGDCVTKENCTEKCTCIYGEWDCEDHSCNSMQSCRVMDGELGCYWKDPCKYENGGCSDFCGHDDDYNTVCSCRSKRVLSKDTLTCIDISPTFFDASGDSCDATFNVWKAEFQTWQDNYLPEWKKELEAYRNYVESGIVSTDLDVCQFEWTEFYNGDDPSGCGDEETLDLLRVKYPKICEKPIWAEAMLADGRRTVNVMAKFQVDAYGLVCKNADQEKGVRCPDFSVRFLCRVPAETDKTTCG